MGTPKKRHSNSPGHRHMRGPHGGYHKKPVAPYPGRRPPERHYDGALLGDERAEFFLGLPVDLRSSWLVQAQWDEEWSRLTVTFAGGFRCSIWCDADLAERFANTVSKGGWWHDVVMAEGREVTPE